jgi:MarR family transcriptional regulator, transcriptional regulator for hemolysin
MLPLTFGFLLHDTARLMRRDFERRSRSSGLTRAQWAVLAYLARSEGTSQAALAEMLEIEPITLVRLLDRLETAGWVERRPDPTDRRVRRLFLTGTARPLMEQFQELASATREAALAGLNEVERRLLTDLLTKVRTNLSGRDLTTEAAGSQAAERSPPKVSQNA